MTKEERHDELQFLLYGVVLYFALVGLYICVTGPFFLNWAAGNRDGPKPAAVKNGFRGRINKCIKNTRDNLLMFAIVVFVAHLRGISNSSTRLGARAFLVGRIFYAIAYVLGIPWLRSVVWVLAVAGNIVILAQALKAHSVGTLYLEQLDHYMDQLAAAYATHVQPQLRHLEL